MNLFTRKPVAVPTAEDALPGRDDPIETSFDPHLVLGTSITPPFPEGTERAIFGMGCFWGAERIFWELGLPPEKRHSQLTNTKSEERLFWKLPDVYTTAVGYAGGITPNPTYEEACSGRTGHTEAVLVVFDPSLISYGELLKTFWEGHDPTQGMRQGNDVGSQYRSAVYWTTDAQRDAVLASRDLYQEELSRARHGQISTEIAQAGTFYYAENYHQQYLARNPNGYCGIGGTGVACPIGLGVTS